MNGLVFKEIMDSLYGRCPPKEHWLQPNIARFRPRLGLRIISGFLRSSSSRFRRR